MKFNYFSLKTVLLILLPALSYCKEADESIAKNVPLTLTIDLAFQSKAIKNIFSDINLWDFREDWLNTSTPYPTDYFSKNFPFVKNIQFMTATGGIASRDLFENPSDRSTVTDYKFDELIRALRNVVRQGLKPMIKTGNVPLKFSQSPKIGVFGVNVRPPDDYEVYYLYIKALGNALVREFGITEVKTWSWGVLTEYENKDWFLAKEDDPAASATYYFKLYDYTVAALEASIGAENLKIGAHSMTVSNGSWDELTFIDHVAKGVNYKTGKKGTQLDFLCTSFYDKSPGIPHPSNLTLTASIEHLRKRALANGLTNLEYGVDEGRLLFGPPDDGRDLWSRVVGHSFQGAADARMFKTMLDCDADWFSSWGLTTERLWEGVKTVATHIAELGYRMVGNKRVLVTRTGSPETASNEVDAIGGMQVSSGKAHLMVYNYNPDIHATAGETVTITLKNIAAAKGGKITVRQWIVDDAHGNFWPAWWKDMTARGLENKSFSWSKYSVDVPRNMIHQADKDFWYSKENSYKNHARLDATVTTMPVKYNTLTIKPMLSPHAVLFLELSGLKN